MNCGVDGKSRVPTPAPTYTSFDQILSMYASTTKEMMEDGGACAAPSNTMFNTNQRVARAELAKLKVGSAEYAGWLDTPQGLLFEANLADPDELKFVSYLGAATFEPGEFTTPLYDPVYGGGKSTRDGPDEEELPVVGTGLDCLPQSVSNGAELSLANKLVVLNCLVFSTPHDFWVKGGERSRAADRLRDAIDSRYRRFAWLDRGDWECTLSPDGPIPSCLKHDVAYGGLQEFAGMDANTSLTAPPDGTELDEAWNPRNKALADAKFKADISKWGCQDQTPAAEEGICRLAVSFLYSNAAMAEWPYFWGTARTNDKGWPVTARDLRHIEGHPRFIVCSEPVVPTVSGVTVTRTGDIITANWTFEPGCVPVTLADVTFEVEWGIRGVVPLQSGIDRVTSCVTRGHGVTCSYDFGFLSNSVIHTIEVFVTPNDKEYGGDNYGGRGKNGRRQTMSIGPFEF